MALFIRMSINNILTVLLANKENCNPLGFNMDDKNNISAAAAIGRRLRLETNSFKTAAAGLV